MTVIFSTDLVATSLTAPKTNCVPAEAAFVLIPSQVSGASHAVGRSRGRRKKTKSKTKVPGIAALESDGYDSSTSAGAGDQVVYNAEVAEKSTNIEGFSSMSSFPASVTSEVSTSSKKTRRKRLFLPRTGNLPDVYW